MSENEPNSELEVIKEIESHLDFIFGHLRDVRKRDGEEAFNRLHNYFNSKYGQVFKATN